MTPKISCFLSITAAQLFVYHLGLMNFLSSKIGFPGFRKNNHCVHPHHTQPIHPELCYKNTNPKYQRHKLFVPNFKNSASALFDVKINFINARHLQNSHALKGMTPAQYVYDYGYFENSLLSLAAQYKNDPVFLSIVNQQFQKRFKPHPIINETFGEMLYFFINHKNLNFYHQCVVEHGLFSETYLDMFEALVLNHLGGANEKETLRHSLMTHLFLNTVRSHKIKDLSVERKNKILSFWLMDYLFKLESSNIAQTAAVYNLVVKSLESIDFLKNIEPHIYSDLLKEGESGRFFSQPPVYQSPQFMEFSHIKLNIDFIDNKIFFYNIILIYKNYCEEELSFLFSDKVSENLGSFKSAAEQQFLAQSFGKNLPHTKKPSKI